ncbi:MAG: ribonuclease ribonuclease [Candidatus Nomurabacteria bacterium]|nr:ribonuclease ribonuclease [Candidatus Nomurabacteria bacterium]
MTIEEFKERNKISFKNDKLLEQAFIHRSYINESGRTGLNHNERLEFLGDAVLELIVTEYLYETYPNQNEGDLTAYRSALVNAVTLGEVASYLSFNDMMRLSKGEAKDVTRARSSILADAYEAFIGALYLDQGYAASKEFIKNTILIKTEDIIKNGLYKDAKSLVQERAQDIYSVTPFYKLLDEEGPDHDKRFTVGIFFGDEKVAEGAGKSKQEAETLAAREAIKIKNWK